jgi:hypothetical protein
MILESRVDEAEINEEIRNAFAALNPAEQMAVAGAALKNEKVLVEEPAFRPALRRNIEGFSP